MIHVYLATFQVLSKLAMFAMLRRWDTAEEVAVVMNPAAVSLVLCRACFWVLIIRQVAHIMRLLLDLAQVLSKLTMIVVLPQLDIAQEAVVTTDPAAVLLVINQNLLTPTEMCPLDGAPDQILKPCLAYLRQPIIRPLSLAEMRSVFLHSLFFVSCSAIVLFDSRPISSSTP